MRTDTCDRMICVQATVENMTVVSRFLDELLSSTSCSARARMQLELAVEELFVNIATHAYGARIGQVTLCGGISDTPPSAWIRFSDAGTPYNPLERDDPDTDMALAERDVGKMGVFLAKNSVDDMHYEYRDGKNILTIGKKLD